MAEKAGYKMTVYIWTAIKPYSPDASLSSAEHVADRIINNDYTALDLKRDFDIPLDIGRNIISESKNRIMESEMRDKTSDFLWEKSLGRGGPKRLKKKRYYRKKIRFRKKRF